MSAGPKTSTRAPLNRRVQPLINEKTDDGLRVIFEISPFLEYKTDSRYVSYQSNKLRARWISAAIFGKHITIAPFKKEGTAVVKDREKMSTVAESFGIL